MNPAQHLLRFAIRCYRWGLSPVKAFVLGPQARCRFVPTCSEFALEAVARHGAGRGTWLTIRRVGRCHPWGGCGHDPVPSLAPVKADSHFAPADTGGQSLVIPHH